MNRLFGIVMNLFAAFLMAASISGCVVHAKSGGTNTNTGTVREGKPVGQAQPTKDAASTEDAEPTGDSQSGAGGTPPPPPPPSY